jgi:hypothetical protein
MGTPQSGTAPDWLRVVRIENCWRLWRAVCLVLRKRVLISRSAACGAFPGTAYVLTPLGIATDKTEFVSSVRRFRTLPCWKIQGEFEPLYVMISGLVG